MAETKRLDVTVLPPAQKHSTIFSTFENLPKGDAMIIHNDHDPKPLYYALTNGYGDIFEWEYLEQGPQIWEVKISKKP